MIDPFAEALHSDGPDPDLADKLKLYGRFVGAWTFDATRHLEDGTSADRARRGAFRLGAGRQSDPGCLDPACAEHRRPASLGPWTFYGTTLRVYDPGADAWHIFWSDPRNQYYSRQLGSRRGRHDRPGRR